MANIDRWLILWVEGGWLENRYDPFAAFADSRLRGNGLKYEGLTLINVSQVFVTSGHKARRAYRQKYQISRAHIGNSLPAQGWNQYAIPRLHRLGRQLAHLNKAAPLNNDIAFRRISQTVPVGTNSRRNPGFGNGNIRITAVIGQFFNVTAFGGEIGFFAKAAIDLSFYISLRFLSGYGFLWSESAAPATR